MTRASPISCAVVYLARGAEKGHLDQIKCFVRSYLRHRPGLDHTLYVIFKGYTNNRAERRAHEALASLRYTTVHTDDLSFDLGAYADATRSITQDQICYLNTNAEIAAEDWLLKLALNLARPRVGAVAATGSYESLSDTSQRFPSFPNPHLRSNAFMALREHISEYLSSAEIKSKGDAYMLESGPQGITQQMIARGLIPIVVGRNGRGYGMEWWPHSFTFRRGMQENLLVHDNVTRTYQEAPVASKMHFTRLSWADPDQPVNVLAAR